MNAQKDYEEFKQNFFQQLQKDLYVDVWVNVSWKIAKIINISSNNDFIQVICDGDGDLIKLPFNPKFVAPFKSNTKLKTASTSSHTRILDLESLDEMLSMWEHFFKNKDFTISS